MSENTNAPTPKQVVKKPINSKAKLKEDPIKESVLDVIDKVVTERTDPTISVLESEIQVNGALDLGELLDRTNVLLALGQAIDVQQKFAIHADNIDKQMREARDELETLQGKAKQDVANAALHLPIIERAEKQVEYIEYLHKKSMLRYIRAAKIIDQLDDALEK